MGDEEPIESKAKHLFLGLFLVVLAVATAILLRHFRRLR